VDRIRVGYFLEDVGQENFVRALVVRVAREIGLAPQQIRHEVRNATGGRGMVLKELQRFLRDVNHERERPFVLLVVAIDGDCHGYRQRRDEIRALVEQSGYPGAVICAVPDPHIERWYLADPRGLRQVLDANTVPQVPTYKCERGRYKQALRDAIRQTGIIALLGGLEYGSDVAEALDLYAVGKADAGFKHFVDELRAGLAPFVSRQEIRE
jgi:hypothetical protein